MQYKVLHKNLYNLDDYALVPYREEDMFKIMTWRNDQMDVLRQKEKLTKEKQEECYKKIIEPTFVQEYPKMILFSFLKNDICIGYGGLTNVDYDIKRAEISYLVDPKRIKDGKMYGKEFSIFLHLIKQIAFDKLGLNRIFTETYDIRPVHIETLEKNGFRREGVMKKHVKIKGEFVDSVIHGLLRSDYDAKK